MRITIAGVRPVDIILCKHGWQARAIARAERVDGRLRVVLARDLVLLSCTPADRKTSGTSMSCCASRRTDTLVMEVNDDLPALSTTMKQLWAQVRAEQT